MNYFSKVDAYMHAITVQCFLPLSRSEDQNQAKTPGSDLLKGKLCLKQASAVACGCGGL